MFSPLWQCDPRILTPPGSRSASGSNPLHTPERTHVNTSTLLLTSCGRFAEILQHSVMLLEALREKQTKCLTIMFNFNRVICHAEVLHHVQNPNAVLTRAFHLLCVLLQHSERTLRVGCVPNLQWAVTSSGDQHVLVVLAPRHIEEPIVPVKAVRKEEPTENS